MAGQHDGHRERLKQAADNDPELATFSEYQTLEYFLSFFIPRKDTNSIAHALIEKFGDINGVLHASKDELYEVSNMTDNASRFLSTFHAFVRKLTVLSQKPKQKVKSVDQAVEVLRPYFYERNVERVYLLALDINDYVLQVCPISEGLSDFTTLDSSRIITAINRTKACKVILAHNHPGGTLRPSSQDIRATKTMFYVLHTLNTVLADHIIFTNDGHFSFYFNGNLDSLMLNSSQTYGTDNIETLRAQRETGFYIYEPKASESEK